MNLIKIDIGKSIELSIQIAVIGYLFKLYADEQPTACVCVCDKQNYSERANECQRMCKCWSVKPTKPMKIKYPFEAREKKRGNANFHLKRFCMSHFHKCHQMDEMQKPIFAVHHSLLQRNQVCSSPISTVSLSLLLSLSHFPFNFNFIYQKNINKSTFNCATLHTYTHTPRRTNINEWMIKWHTS